MSGGLAMWRRAKDIRAQGVARYASHRFDSQHALGWNATARLPLTDGGRADADSIGKSLLRTSRLDRSLDWRHVLVHVADIRPPLI